MARLASGMMKVSTALMLLSSLFSLGSAAAVAVPKRQAVDGGSVTVITTTLMTTMTLVIPVEPTANVAPYSTTLTGTVAGTASSDANHRTTMTALVSDGTFIVPVTAPSGSAATRTTTTMTFAIYPTPGDALIRTTTLIAVFSPVPPTTAAPFEQCGGINYDGPTACTSGCVCQYQSQFHSECLPVPVEDEDTTTTKLVTQLSTVTLRQTVFSPIMQTVFSPLTQTVTVPTTVTAPTPSVIVEFVTVEPPAPSVSVVTVTVQPPETITVTADPSDAPVPVVTVTTYVDPPVSTTTLTRPAIPTEPLALARRDWSALAQDLPELAQNQSDLAVRKAGPDDMLSIKFCKLHDAKSWRPVCDIIDFKKTLVKCGMYPDIGFNYVGIFTRLNGSECVYTYNVPPRSKDDRDWCKSMAVPKHEAYGGMICGEEQKARAAHCKARGWSRTLPAGVNKAGEQCWNLAVV